MSYIVKPAKESAVLDYILFLSTDVWRRTRQLTGTHKLIQHRTSFTEPLTAHPVNLQLATMQRKWILIWSSAIGTWLRQSILPPTRPVPLTNQKSAHLLKAIRHYREWIASIPTQRWFRTTSTNKLSNARRWLKQSNLHKMQIHCACFVILHIH